MDEPDDTAPPGKWSVGRRDDAAAPYYSTLGAPTTPGDDSRRSCTPGGRSVTDRSTAAGESRSSTPEPPPVPPATYHWEEVRRQRSVGGYPWTHLDKPAFDESTWVKYERDHVYEPVTPAASADRTTPAKRSATGGKDDGGRHFLRIPLTEEVVMMADDDDDDDDTGTEPEDDGGKRPRPDKVGDDDDDDKRPRAVEEEEDDDDDDEEEEEKKPSARSDESIYEGENENSSVGETGDANRTRIKMFQQKVKVKADVLRAKLRGVTKRKPKQKIVVDDGPCNGDAGGEKARRKFGQFATLPKKFTFNAPKVNFSAAFGGFSRTTAAAAADANESSADDAKTGGRFSLPRFGFAKTSSSESPKARHKAAKIGAWSVPSFRARAWSDASKASASPKPRQLIDFGTYPRIFSKRKKTNGKAQTPPPMSRTRDDDDDDDAEPAVGKRKESFRRRFFRSHKESTPAPTAEQTATLAVEEELDEAHVSKESLAEFGDSDLQEVISLSDDCSRSAKDTKSLSSEHRPGVIEEIDSDEFFLREKGLSRGDVHISNYLSSEIRDVFRSNRTRPTEIVNRDRTTTGANGRDDDGGGVVAPTRPSRTNSLRRPARYRQNDSTTAAFDRFSTMPKSFGGARSAANAADVPDNIITSQTFEPSGGSALPSAFRVPWRTTAEDHREKKDDHSAVAHMPPKPPTRQRMATKFCTFDTRSMIDLSRKRSQSQIGFLPNFSETVPKAPLRRSRASLAGSERDVSVTPDNRPPWTIRDVGAPTPPLRRSRVSLTADADERPTAVPPARPPPPPTSATAGYATVDKTSSSLLVPPQSPVRHRRKKSYDVIKSQEFGAFFTVPRSYHGHQPTAGRTVSSDDEPPPNGQQSLSPPPSRPARAYHTLGPSRPLRRRLPVREHEYGDVTDGGDERLRQSKADGRSSLSLNDGDGAAKALCSGRVIEKMKLRPLPSPPPPPRNKPKTTEEPPPWRRNTDSAVVPFLDRREASATSCNADDFFADVSRALLASAAKNSVHDDVSVAVQTDPPDDELDDAGSSCCSAESDRPTSGVPSSAAITVRPASRMSTTVDRPTSRTSMTTEYVDRPASRMSPATTTAVERGYATLPPDVTGVICAQRINVDELQVGKMTVADISGQRMGVDHLSGSSLQIARLAAAAAILPPPPPPQIRHRRHVQQDDAVSVQSSRVSSMYPEVDSDEDRTSSVMDGGAPTPPRRRSKLATRSPSKNDDDDDDHHRGGDPSTVVDPSITELSCQLFRLCHTNVCNLFNKVVQQVVPEDTEKRRDLQAALCFLSIILAGLLILGFGNEKTVHHHHWDFQFPPSNQ